MIRWCSIMVSVEMNQLLELSRQCMHGIKGFRSPAIAAHPSNTGTMKQYQYIDLKYTVHYYR